MREVCKHPCYSNEAHFRYARIHLPVAPRCNVQCNYCVREYCANENRPGTAKRIIKPHEVADYLSNIIKEITAETTTIGISGPGESLYNEETFETLEIINELYPNTYRCLATNGLLVEDRLDDLIECSLTHLTITINTVNPATASKIYPWVNYNGRIYRGFEAGEVMVERQLSGLKEAAEAGILVKVNTIYIPTVNEQEIVEVARAVSEYAYIMSITPLIPLGSFSVIRKPTPQEISKARRSASRYISQFHHCSQCRADAFGILGC